MNNLMPTVEQVESLDLEKLVTYYDLYISAHMLLQAKPFITLGVNAIMAFRDTRFADMNEMEKRYIEITRDVMAAVIALVIVAQQKTHDDAEIAELKALELLDIEDFRLK